MARFSTEKALCDIPDSSKDSVPNSSSLVHDSNLDTVAPNSFGQRQDRRALVIVCSYQYHTYIDS
jgi:hypothetical protein